MYAIWDLQEDKVAVTYTGDYYRPLIVVKESDAKKMLKYYGDCYEIRPVSIVEKEG